MGPPNFISRMQKCPPRGGGCSRVSRVQKASSKDEKFKTCKLYWGAYFNLEPDLFNFNLCIIDLDRHLPTSHKSSSVNNHKSMERINSQSPIVFCKSLEHERCAREWVLKNKIAESSSNAFLVQRSTFEDWLLNFQCFGHRCGTNKMPLVYIQSNLM